MRARLLALLLVVAPLAGGCTSTRSCKQGTVLVSVDGADGADLLRVHFSVVGGATADGDLPLHGKSGGTVEIDFPSYPSGQSVRWQISALKGGDAIAVSDDGTTLTAGCAVIDIHLAPPGDLGFVDGFTDAFVDGSVDLSSIDGAKAPGAACTPSDVCGGGTTCVDGYCCNRACTGQCEACNLTGHEGTCTQVSGAPVAPRTACAGGGTVCAGSCDGMHADCVFPTTQCSAPTCSGGVARAATSCNLGACPSPSPVACTPAICGDTACAKVTQVSAGGTTACAVLDDGSVMCWGDNFNGGVGVSPSPIPSPSPLPPTRVPGVAGATQVVQNGSGCALLGDKTVKCWGVNVLGNIGIGNDDGKFYGATTVLTGPAAPLTNVVQLAVGPAFTCAVTGDKAAYCWGYTEGSTSGLFGAAGPETLYATPVCARESINQSCALANDVLEIAPGSGHTCMRAVGGAVACWGNNTAGDCGQPGGAVNQPKTIAGLTANRIAAGQAVSCALLGDGSGKIVCWGDNSDGMLGQGATDSAAHPSPSPVCGDGSCITQLGGFGAVAVGGKFVCGLNGIQPICWGRNNHGQLLTGNKTDRFYGFSSGSAQASQISAGTDFGCSQNSALGTAQCWGADNKLQIGDGDTADKVMQTAPLLGR